MIRARTAIPPIRHPRFPENPPGPPDSSPSRLATVIRQEGSPPLYNTRDENRETRRVLHAATRGSQFLREAIAALRAEERSDDCSRKVEKRKEGVSPVEKRIRRELIARTWRTTHRRSSLSPFEISMHTRPRFEVTLHLCVYAKRK